MTIVRQIEKRARGSSEPTPRSVHASQLVPYSPALAEPEYIEVDSEEPQPFPENEVEPDRDPDTTTTQGPLPRRRRRKTASTTPP